MTKSVRIDRSGILRLQRRARAKGDLLVWSIYAHPWEIQLDFPDAFVVRPFSTRLGAKPLLFHFADSSLEVVRWPLRRMGLICIHRSENDAPCLLESWL